MTTAPVTIRVEHGGHTPVLLPASDPVREVGRLLRTYADASDVTISMEITDDDLMVALEAGQAFIGLVTADGDQYVADDAADGTCQFIIGDGPADTAHATCCRCPGPTSLLTQRAGGSPPLAGPGAGTAITSSMTRASHLPRSGLSVQQPRARIWTISAPARALPTQFRRARIRLGDGRPVTDELLLQFTVIPKPSWSTNERGNTPVSTTQGAATTTAAQRGQLLVDAGDPAHALPDGSQGYRRLPWEGLFRIRNPGELPFAGTPHHRCEFVAGPAPAPVPFVLDPQQAAQRQVHDGIQVAAPGKDRPGNADNPGCRDRAVEVTPRELREHASGGGHIRLRQHDTALSQRAGQHIADLAGVIAVQPGQLHQVLAVVTADQPVRRPQRDLLGTYLADMQPDCHRLR